MLSRTTNIVLLRSFLIVIACALILAPAAFTADDGFTTGVLDFSTSGQRLDAPNGSPTADELSITLIDKETAQMSNTLGIDNVVEAGLEGVFTIKLGIKAGIDVTAKTALSLKLQNKADGLVNVNYPVRVNIKFPEANSFARGNEIKISTSMETASSGDGPMLDGVPAKMVVTPPTVGGTFSSGIELDFDLVGRIYYLFGDDGVEYDLYNTGFMPFDLFTMTPQRDVAPEDTSFTVKSDGTIDLGVRHLFDDWLEQEFGFSGIADTPYTPVSVHSLSGGTLSSTGTYQFMKDFALNVTKHMSKKGVGLEGTHSILHGGEVKYVIGQVLAVLNASQSQSLSFTPTVLITLGFKEPVSYRVEKPDGTIYGQGSSDKITFPAGCTLYVTYPDKTDPMSLDQTTLFDGQGNNFTNSTSNTYVRSADFQVGRFGITIPGINYEGVGIPDINLPSDYDDGGMYGPIVSGSISFPDLPTQTVVESSWHLDGFSPFAKPSAFDLDPENPVTKISEEVSDVQNNGDGNRTITYTYKLENKGDVPLYHVQIVDDLSKTFEQAEWFDVVDIASCDLEVNEDFDGRDDTNLLTDEVGVSDGGNSLSVGQTALVIMRVTVAPGPSPFPGTQPYPFTNKSTAHGTSAIKLPYIPNGTHVTANSESTVNLGPAQIAGLSDFVLYAGHKLQLHQAANSFGHIGSSDMIEVLNGDSGVLAGDIRSIGHIAVHGSLIADYVFTNQSVILTGDLDVTGRIQEGFNLSGFEIPTMSGTPGTQAVKVPKGTTLMLDPGSYGNVTVGSGARLVLKTGDYNFASLLVDPLAVISFQSQKGPIDVYVEGRVVIGEGSQMIVPPFPASTRDVTIFVKKEGHIQVLNGAVVRGTLIAPTSKITFNDGSRLEGAAYANMLVVERGASFQYHRATPGALYLQIDTDNDGMPNCIGDPPIGEMP